MVKQSLFLLVAAFISSAAAQNVQVNVSGTMWRYAAPTGPLVPASKYQVGDTFTATLVYDPALLTMQPYDSPDYWSRWWMSTTAISAYDVSIFRAGDLVEHLDLLADGRTPRLFIGTTGSQEDGTTEEEFAVRLTDFIQDEAAYPTIENYIKLDLLAVHDVFTAAPFDPEQVLDPDRYTAPQEGTTFFTYFYILSRYWADQNHDTDKEMYEFTIDSVTVTPEPATLVLLICGAALVRRKI